MYEWYTYLKKGLSRRRPKDRISGREDHSDIKSNLKNLHPYVRRHWKKGAWGFLLLMFTSLLAFPQPLVTRFIIDDVIVDRRVELLAGAVLLLIGILLTEKLMRLLERFYFVRFEQSVILEIQQDLTERVLRFPKTFFDTNQTGYLMSRLSSDVGGLRWFFSSTIVHLAGNIIHFLGGLLLLFYLEWRLALIVLMILPGVVLCMRYFSGKIHILSHEIMEQEANVSSRFQESLASVSLIKAFASEAGAIRRLVSELKGALQISLEQTTVSSVANLVISAIPGMARAIVLALGAYWVITEHWTLGSWLAFQAYLGYVFGPAQFLASANLELQTALAALERVSALFDIVPEENLGRGEEVERLKGKIEFRNVSFSYDVRKPVLRDVSFLIQPGERVAIVGPSGVGKTTLLSLILRFYRPSAGEIYFDDRPASLSELGSLRQRIGYVSQRTSLLSGSIIENMCLGNPEMTEDQAIRAAKAAGIHEFISSLHEGYETVIGEDGVNLSEGQKQRISIARALIKEPDILVLDEPTSSLDSSTEKSILDALPSFVQEKTLFVVSNRLSSMVDSDRILLLDATRLVATGTHESLLETNDYYRSLVL